ncbi:hypothetical protein GCM10023213_19620 [Prosthecobacter algae]|uniref:Tyr recombinase domain-containing protein n=1 Tax=Prosthecobacter algae TaxID=1144682 RepID=A0ABP9P8C1_9BACT
MPIRKRKLPSGKIVYQLDLGMVDGKRVQKNYPTGLAAKTAQEDHENAAERHGTSLTHLTSAEITEVLLVRSKLKDAGATLTEAAEFFLKHGVTKESISFGAMVQRFLNDKYEHSTPRYHRQLKVSLGALKNELESRPANEIRGQDIERWLKRNKWAPKTWVNYLGDASALFSWGIKKGYLSLNPCAEVAKPKLGDGEIGTLTVEQCELLLRAAVKDPQVIGFVVLGLYAGLRPAEIARLDWSAVDLEAATVVVAGSQAKTRRRRIVDLSENAVAWLKASGLKLEGKITGKWWDGRWRVFRSKLGWDAGNSGDGLSRNERKKARKDPEPAPFGRWPHNALRHTYASMHYAMHQNEAQLQTQMGHESAAMLHRHYRALKTKTDASKFWALKP